MTWKIAELMNPLGWSRWNVIEAQIERGFLDDAESALMLKFGANDRRQLGLRILAEEYEKKERWNDALRVLEYVQGMFFDPEIEAKIAALRSKLKSE